MIPRPKWNGCCILCRTPVYEVLSVFETGPLAGGPRRIGRALQTQCQIELLMSDGSTADITCCLGCLSTLTPASYQPIWEACQERNQLDLQAVGRSENDCRAHAARDRAVWPVGWWLTRRTDPDTGLVVVDRRLRPQTRAAGPGGGRPDPA